MQHHNTAALSLLGNPNRAKSADNFDAHVLHTSELGGANISPFAYGGLVPLVAIYKIDYPLYYTATGATGTGTG